MSPVRAPLLGDNRWAITWDAMPSHPAPPWLLPLCNTKPLTDKYPANRKLVPPAPILSALCATIDSKVKFASETISDSMNGCSSPSHRRRNSEKGPGSSPGPWRPHKHQRLRPERPGVSDRRAVCWPVPVAKPLPRTRHPHHSRPAPAIIGRPAGPRSRPA